MLAQAQRAVGTNSIDRFMGTLGQVAQYKPEVLDRPVEAQNDPAGHCVHTDMLGDGPKVPMGHTVELVSPVELQNDPAEQLTHTERPSDGPKVPAGQAEQADD